MAQMKFNYAQFVVELNPEDIRCVLTTDARPAFQYASRNNCYKVLYTETRCVCPHSLLMHIRAPSESFSQQQTCLSDHHLDSAISSKLFTYNTASLVQGLLDAATTDATTVAIVDDITIMGTLAAVV